MAVIGESLLERYLEHIKYVNGFEKIVDKAKITSATNGIYTAEIQIQSEHKHFVDVISRAAFLINKNLNTNFKRFKSAKIGDVIEFKAKILRPIGKTSRFFDLEIKNTSTGLVLVKIPVHANAFLAKL